MQLAQVVHGGLQMPLALARGEAAHGELPSTLAVLHLAKHRLYRGAALGVDGPPALRAQLALHALARRQPLRHPPPWRGRIAQLGPLLAVLARGDEQLAFLGLARRVLLRPVAGIRRRGPEHFILAQHQLDQLRTVLAGESTRIRERLAALQSPHVEPELRTRLQATGEALSVRLDAMGDTIATRLSLRAARTQAAAALREAIDALDGLARMHTENATALLVTTLTSLLQPRGEVPGVASARGPSAAPLPAVPDAERNAARDRLLDLDLDTLEVTRAGTVLKLKPTSRKLLEVLMQKSPNLVRRSELEETIWGRDAPQGDNLRSNIHILRSIIDKQFDSPLLHTVHGLGYQLCEKY